MYDSKGVRLNSKAVNKCITYSLLPREEMEKIGFRFVTAGGNDEYYYCKTLVKGITLNVTLPVEINQDELDIAVLDENFLQPYDFQRILNENPNFGYARKVADIFENEMRRLEKVGILHGHRRGEYV